MGLHRKLVGVFSAVVVFCSLNWAASVVADHTVVDAYEDIPERWLDSVKTMLVCYVGESHGMGLLYGLRQLAEQEPEYAVSVTIGGFPESQTDSALRIHRGRYDNTEAYSHSLDSERRWRGGGGEQHMWTSSVAVEAVKAQLEYARDDLQNPYRAYCFGWCWDMCWQSNCSNVGEWAGRAFHWNDPECTGRSCWQGGAVDHWDTSSTEVNMSHYIGAWEHIGDAHQEVRMLHSTGPVDGSCDRGCRGYQRFQKHEYIRRKVAERDGYLFDYADILCWSNEGEQHTTDFSGHTFQMIHPDNDGEYDGGDGGCHIGLTGCVRLAKAMWWLLARSAGWEGSSDQTGSISPYERRKGEESDHSNPIRIKLANRAYHQGSSGILYSGRARDFSGRVLRVHNAAGEMVLEVNLGEEGQCLDWNGRYEKGITLADGLYICSITGEGTIGSLLLTKM